MSFRTLSVFVFAFTFALPSQAQIFGFKGGVQQTNITTDENGEIFDTEIGYTVGLFLNIPLPYNFGILAEGLYAQKIVTQNNLEVMGNGTPNMALELGYVEIPILLAYRLPSEGWFHPRFYSGPVIGAIVNETIDLKGKDFSDIFNEATILTKEAFQDRERGWMFGAGGSLDLSKTGYTKVQLLVDLRYTTGLTTLSEDFAGNPLATQIRMGAFTAMLGIGF